MNTIFNSQIFSKPYIENQNLFRYNSIQSIISELTKGRVGDRIYLIWALLIFQNWYHKNLVQHD